MRNQAVTGLVIAGMMLAAMGCESEQPEAAAQVPSARSSAATTPGAAQTGDPARYCQLTEQLEAYGREAFAGLGRNATAAEYRRVERRFVIDNAAALRELEAAVPERLRDDVRTFVTSMRQRGGLEPSGTVTSADASAAEQEVRAYERRACRE